MVGGVGRGAGGLEDLNEAFSEAGWLAAWLGGEFAGVVGWVGVDMRPFSRVGWAACWWWWSGRGGSEKGRGRSRRRIAPCTQVGLCGGWLLQQSTAAVPGRHAAMQLGDKHAQTDRLTSRQQSKQTEYCAPGAVWRREEHLPQP